MVEKKPASKTVVITCNKVTNDQFKRSGKSFKNIKDGDGRCTIIINNNKTGKSSKSITVDNALLAERVVKKKS